MAGDFAFYLDGANMAAVNSFQGDGGITWYHSTGKTARLDYVCVLQPLLSACSGTRVYEEVDLSVDSPHIDHMMVAARCSLQAPEVLAHCGSLAGYIVE